MGCTGLMGRMGFMGPMELMGRMGLMGRTDDARILWHAIFGLDSA